MSEQSRFPIGSMTKMFTALTVLALASSGQIDLHAPIARYLPELSDSTGPGQVTLDQLLSHTSGLTPKAELCARADEDISDVVRKYAAQPLWAPPGAVYNYSNLNYVFAGAVLERESGARFEQLVLDRVLVPLGLSEASFEPEAVRGRGLVKGDAAPILPRCRAMWPAGGLALTAAELGHFLDLVSKPERFPLGERLLDDLTAPRTATGMRDGEHYGYGISRFRAGGVEFFNHGGRLPGYASFIAWTPARRAGAAALANRHSSWPLAAVAQTLSAMLALPLRAFLPQPSPSHPLDQYVGTYVDRIGGLGVVRIRRDGSSLVMDSPWRAIPASGHVSLCVRRRCVGTSVRRD